MNLLAALGGCLMMSVGFVHPETVANFQRLREEAHQVENWSLHFAPIWSAWYWHCSTGDEINAQLLGKRTRHHSSSHLVLAVLRPLY